MEIVSVSCNHCGAPLEVSAGTQYVTCGHCGSRLAIKRSGAAIYTEMLEKLDQKTDVMTRQLAEIAYRSELDRLDREWEQDRQKFLSTDKHGKSHEPNELGARIGGGIAIGFGLLWTLLAAGMVLSINSHSPAGDGPLGFIYCFPLFGLAVIGAGVWMFVKGPAQARQYEAARRAYKHRRDAVTVEQFLQPPSDSPR